MTDEQMRTLAAQATAIYDVRMALRHALARDADARLLASLYAFLTRLEAARDLTLEECAREDALPFCACGRTWTDCDGSRAACAARKDVRP